MEVLRSDSKQTSSDDETYHDENTAPFNINLATHQLPLKDPRVVPRCSRKSPRREKKPTRDHIARKLPRIVRPPNLNRTTELVGPCVQSRASMLRCRTRVCVDRVWVSDAGEFEAWKEEGIYEEIKDGYVEEGRFSDGCADERFFNGCRDERFYNGYSNMCDGELNSCHEQNTETISSQSSKICGSSQREVGVDRNNGLYDFSWLVKSGIVSLNRKNCCAGQRHLIKCHHNHCNSTCPIAHSHAVNRENFSTNPNTQPCRKTFPLKLVNGKISAVVNVSKQSIIVTFRQTT